MFFSENVNDTIQILQGGLERINTYIRSEDTSKPFNSTLAFDLKRVADCIRKDNSKITDDLFNAINQLNDSFKKTSKTKINIPSYKKLLDICKRCWDEMPHILKLTSIILIIFLFVWYAPKIVGLNVDDNTRYIAMITVFAIIIPKEEIKNVLKGVIQNSQKKDRN